MMIQLATSTASDANSVNLAELQVLREWIDTFDF